jgi:hypothetical protein
MNKEPKRVRFNLWGNLRRVLLSLACLATVVLVFYTVENWRGRRAWQAYVRESASAGRNLSLAATIPPAVPDVQNFCQCPLLSPILNLGKVNGRFIWYDTNGLARINALGPWLGSAGPGSATTNSLKDWQAWYRSLTNLADLYLTNSPAEDVLMVLRRFDPDLAELKEEAARRPLDRWAIHYDMDAPLEIALPHLAKIKQICVLLQVRESALFATGNAPGAISDFGLGARLAESVRSEPFMISQMVRGVCWEILLPPLREGLRGHQLMDAQLADLQARLLATDLLPGYELSVASERAASEVFLTVTRRQCDRLAGENWPELFRPFYTIARFGTYAPRGWVYQNQVSLCRLMDTYLVPCVDLPSRTVPPARTEALADAFKRAKGPYSALLSPIFDLQARFGGLYFYGHRLAHAQTQIDQAVIACALERYRLAHGEYPETLDLLVPRFIPKLPHDLIDGRPLHFRRTFDRNYLLYSVGWNGTDESGTIERQDDGQVDFKHGDWVW